MKAEVGTVISGTMRPQDLIPAFLRELEYLDPEKAKGFNAEIPEPPSEDWYESEEAGWILNDLFDALDACSPEGCYFGAHPGDGCDYGFWPCEEEL